MPTIIKKGTCSSSFSLNGREIILIPDVITVLSNEEFSELMGKWGNFIKERTISDKNPSGCFLVSEKSAKAKKQSEEVGVVKDASSPIEVPPSEEVSI